MLDYFVEKVGPRQNGLRFSLTLSTERSNDLLRYHV